MQLLKALALVSTEDPDELMIVSMHPLMHACARGRQNADQQHTHWLAMGSVIAFAYLAGVIHAVDRQLQMHVESVVSGISTRYSWAH